MKNYHFIAYSSSKAALNMMTVNYALQWKDSPRHANAVHPGSVRTELNSHGEISIEEGAKSSVQMATISNAIPNGPFLLSAKRFQSEAKPLNKLPKAPLVLNEWDRFNDLGIEAQGKTD